MIEGRPVSLWDCTKCGALGVGGVYADLNCIGYDGYRAELECFEPVGWYLMTDAIWCPKCYKEETS
jgi:hypothetical protein